jgi:hypothetical protein
MLKISLFVIALFSCVLAYGQTFTNVTTSSGLPVERTILWGFIDYNADGFEDLLASTGTGNPFVLKLFKNNGNSTFSDVTTNAGISEIDSIRFGHVSDFNKDGKQDFLLVDYNNNLRVFCASNSGTFEDKTIASGISLSGSSFPEGFQIVDFNKDGFPDLSFYRSLTGGAKEIVCNLNGFSGSGNNTSAILPPFATDITPQFQFSDYDNDRDLDIIVQCIQVSPSPGAPYYYHPVKIFNCQSNLYSEAPNAIPFNVSAYYLIETDFNQDGNFDFIGGTTDNVFNASPVVPVLKNSGNGSFINSSDNPNFRIGGWYYNQFSESDFDSDGDLDYYSAVDVADGSRFWVNSNGVFSEEGSQLGLRLTCGNGSSPRASWFDLDNDGDLDCFGSADAGNLIQSALAKNNISNSNKWIKVNLKGCQSGTDGFYAVVKAKVGGSSYYRLKSPFQGYLAQSQFLHFGLGTANTIDSLIVKWPSGRTTILTNVAANQTLTVNEDNCNSVSTNCPDLSGSLLQGLIGYWPFCGNAKDESGNNNNGTVNGATLTADRFGNQASAYDFDGQNEYINLNSSFPSGSSPKSFSIWFKSTDTKYRWLLSGGGNSDCNAFGLYQDSTHYAGNFNYDLFFHGNGLQCDYSFSDFFVDSWQHAVISFDGTKAHSYLNGIYRGFKDLNLNTSQSIDLIVGARVGASTFYLGSLDDIAIWNRALTPQEIQQVYNQGICQTSITVTDTLLIHTGITAYNPVAYGNTLKVWPNPGNTAITLDAGNLALMQGWKIRISNSLGQEVYPATLISQQQQVLSMSTWGGNGLYLLHLINPQGHITEVKKIVLAP